MSGFHAATAISIRGAADDADRVAALRDRVRSRLQDIAESSTLRFEHVDAGITDHITYRVTQGALGSGDLRRLEAEFAGFKQQSRDRMTFVTVPLACALRRDGAHALWRRIYIAGMAVCLAGAVYCSGILARQAADGEKPPP